jgi:hypothetical protein
MTLVLETDSGAYKETNSQLNQALDQFGFSSTGDTQVFGEHTFHYYNGDEINNREEVIEKLMQLPAVRAAYFKEEGTIPGSIG